VYIDICRATPDCVISPRVSYYDPTNGDLTYAVRENNRWRIEVVDSAGDVGQFNSLELDDQGIAHIGYYGATSKSGAPTQDLKHAWRIGTGGNCGGGLWQCETIDTNGDVGKFASLAFGNDPEPVVRIAYQANGTDPAHPAQDLKYATLVGAGGNCGGGRWQCDVLVAEGNVGQYASIAVNSAGTSLIAYYDATRGDLAGFSPCPCAVDACSPECPLCCSFHCPGPFALDPAITDRGWYDSLAIDDFNTLHASYFDRTNGDLYYLHVQAGQTSWTPELVDAGGSVGLYTSIATDAQGRPHISYFDATRGDLKYATRP
jgi:hypothetical protein